MAVTNRKLPSDQSFKMQLGFSSEISKGYPHKASVRPISSAYLSELEESDELPESESESDPDEEPEEDEESDSLLSAVFRSLISGLLFFLLGGEGLSLLLFEGLLNKNTYGWQQSTLLCIRARMIS